MTVAENAVALFSQFAQTDGDARVAFLLGHPSLLATAAIAAIEASLAPGAGSPARDDLVLFRSRLDAKQPFPLGSSPIESAWEALVRGEIALDEALRRAAAPELVTPIAYPYVQSLCRYAISIAGRRPDDAVRLASLVLAATEAADPNPEALRARVRASMDFITAAVPLLANIPDGRVYRRASDAGAWLETRAERLDLWPPGELAFRLGVLNLDPYLFDGDLANYQRSFNAWQARLAAALGPAAASIPAAGLAMPAPLDALAKAVAYLTQAAALQTGDALPRAQKALAQAVALHDALSGTTAASAPVAVGMLSPEAALADPVTALMALSSAFERHEIEPAELERRILALPAPETLRKNAGPERAVQVALDAMQLLGRINSPQGLAFAQTYRSCLAAPANTDARMQYWRRELELFDADPSGQDAPARTSFLQTAARAQHENRENDALTALDEFIGANPTTAAAHADALEYLRYLLLAGLASNAVTAQQWAQAIQSYGLALSYCLRYGFNNEALTYAQRIDDLSSHDGDGVGASIAVVLSACALRLEAALGEPAVWLVRSISGKAVTGMLRSGTIDARVYGTTVIAGTATRLGAALRTGIQVNPADDAEAADMLARIAEIEAQIGPQFEPLNDEEILLASFVETTDREEGALPAERLRNLQRAFDTRVDTMLAARAAERRPEPFTLEQLREHLDERSVLLHYFLGATPDGRIATIVLLVTKEDVALTVVAEQFPAALIALDLGNGLRALQPPLATPIAERRSQVCSEPGPRLVDRDAGEGLESDLRRFLGPFVERLAALRAGGKTRLTIVPSGPLHFYPWPLLGGIAAPLADTWAIDVAPSLGFLLDRSPDASQTQQKTACSVIGISFAQPNRLGLPPILASGDEARAVAATLGVEPLLDEAATKAAVLAALERSRYAHVSTHGRHAVVAPGFQTIFCTDDGTPSFGRIAAHEILALDLRGLELLTLSACETALGRYDPVDNLRGLPAAFLLAGVRTIVATLWQAGEDATGVFFPAFYAAVNAGSSHRDAFATAQATTRKRCPKFRDWGCFFLMAAA